jgi:hypothetical protein
LWEFAQTALVLPIVGICAMPNGTLADLRSLICQMPSHVTDVLPFLYATYWESWATLVGLYFPTAPAIQVSASTPAWESYVALLPSSANGWPPFCHNSERNIRCAGQRFGIQKGCGWPEDLSLSRAAVNDASSVGGEEIPAFFRCSVL